MVRSLRASFLVACSASAVLLASACSLHPSSSAAADEDLIGGEIAPADAFPATMHVVGNCTVTRIGERLILTAAHCVRTERGELRPSFERGRSMTLVVRGAEPGVRRVTIARTLLHPQIEHLCKTRGCLGLASAEGRDAPDVAVIEIEQDLPGVPIAEIDVSPAREDDEVTILGYGCTGTVWGSSDGKLRYLDTRIVPVSAAVHAGGLGGGNDVDLGNIDANYAITPGPTSARPADTGGAGVGDAGGEDPERAAGLCPGDSGGALYRKGTNRIVGVNASYTFLPGGSVPVTNWHARVDAESRWGVASWLESLGAKLSAPCAQSGCTPSSSAAGSGGVAPDARNRTNEVGASAGKDIEVQRARTVQGVDGQGEWALCKPGEIVDFNCRTTNGKTLSMCSEDPRFVARAVEGRYRFGHTRDAEVTGKGHVEQALIGPPAKESETTDRRSEFIMRDGTSYIVWSKGNRLDGSLQGGVIVNGSTQIGCVVGTVIDDRSSPD